jgi:isoleucyl-tRNA synthetase
MNVLSAILFDDIPFENIVTTGTILAEDGEKMSKSKNNFPDPMILISKYGTDALRFYLISSTVMNAENFNFSEKGVEEIYKKVILMLYNVTNFYELYDGIKESKLASKNTMDKWIISRVNNLTKETDIYLKQYNTIESCSKIKTFIEELSTWYVRRSRERFNDGDKDAKTTLKYVLDNLSKIIAPIIPFSAEMISKSIGNKNSIHLESWPDFDNKKIDNKLEEEMLKTREIISVALRERDVMKLPLKQPLAKATLYGYEISSKHEEIILEELNIKKIELKKGDKKIELDSKITPELEAEGFAREVLRTVQAARKKANLIKEDLIELQIIFEHKNKELVEKFILEEQKRIGAKNIYFKKADDKYSYSEENTIREVKCSIYFNKI